MISKYWLANLGFKSLEVMTIWKNGSLGESQFPKSGFGQSVVFGEWKFPTNGLGRIVVLEEPFSKKAS